MLIDVKAGVISIRWFKKVLWSKFPSDFTAHMVCLISTSIFLKSFFQFLDFKSSWASSRVAAFRRQSITSVGVIYAIYVDIEKSSRFSEPWRKPNVASENRIFLQSHREQCFFFFRVKSSASEPIQFQFWSHNSAKWAPTKSRRTFSCHN